MVQVGAMSQKQVVETLDKQKRETAKRVCLSRSAGAGAARLAVSRFLLRRSRRAYGNFSGRICTLGSGAGRGSAEVVVLMPSVRQPSVQQPSCCGMHEE